MFRHGGWLSVLVIICMACIAQKSVGLTFTESGKGAGIQSGQVDKTATAAPGTVASTVDSIGAAVVLLEFTIKENGAKDGYPLQIKELRFTNTGTADTADLRFVLEGPGSNNTISTASGNTVTFKDFGDIIVADGDTVGKTYQVKVHIRANIQGSLTDNSNVLLKTSPLTDFDVAEASSNFLPTISSFQQSTATTVTITATELQGKGSFALGTVPVSATFTGAKSFYATDLNGRIDRDYVTNVTIVSRQADCITAQSGLGNNVTDANLTVTPVQGVATWNNLTFNLQPVTFRIYATSGGLTPTCTASITSGP